MPSRSKPSMPTRETLGPPPMTAGIMWLSAPRSTCSPKPSTSTAATEPYPVTAEGRSVAVATRQVTMTMPTRNHTPPAAMDQEAKCIGGFLRAGASSERPVHSSPSR